jgi:CRP-like cAMP-binding protein
MFIVLFGEVGLYTDENQKAVKTARDNQTFGEKALDSLELRDRTAVAHKVTVCLTLNKHEFEEKVFCLQH